MRRALVLLGKEWRELLGQRALILGLMILPVVLTTISLLTMAHIRALPEPRPGETGGLVLSAAIRALPPEAQAQAVAGQHFGLLLLLVPLVVPNVIAAHSVVGEKVRRTLEPLLATPLHGSELLLGKVMGALLPGVVLTWAAAAAYAIGVVRLAYAPGVARVVLSPAWCLSVALCAPLLSVAVIALTVAISSRVNDLRTAQQLSGLVVLPLLLALVAQVSGSLVLSPGRALGGALALVPIDALLLWAAARLLGRDALLRVAG